MALETKNRAANELRAQANALRDKLGNAALDLTKEEVEKISEDIRTLNTRAQAMAEFTADAEIARQGGDADDETIQRATPENENKLQTRSGLGKQVEELNKSVLAEFGTMKDYMDAVTGKNKIITRSQNKVLTQAQLLTRTVIGTASDTSGGEFLLPLQQVSSIFRMDNQQDGLLGRARKYNVSGRVLRIPYLQQDSASGVIDRPTAGIANVAIIGEASEKDVREPKFKERQLTVYKYAAISQLSDEMLSDDFTGELPTALVDSIGVQTMNKINEDVTIDGTGTAMPLGAFHSNNGALLGVSRSGGVNNIVVGDVFKMYEDFVHGPNGFWMCSRSAFTKIAQLNLSGNSLVTYIQNLNNNPRGANLLGYPVVVTDLLPVLGTASDIVLCNPDFYAVALRQALTVMSSIHVAFTQDITTYRFVARGGGIPIPTSTYAYKASAGTKTAAVSPFVSLNA